MFACYDRLRYENRVIFNPNGGKKCRREATKNFGNC